MNASSSAARSPATNANGYDGLGHGSCQRAKLRPSGRAGKYVIRRNPSASHSVQKTLLVPYRPSSALLAAGVQTDSTSAVSCAGTCAIVNVAGDSVNCAGVSGDPSTWTV